MFRVGIVGAENSHSAAIAKILNVTKAVPGFRVTAIWGETKAFAERSAAAGEIPRIVKRPEEMIGEVDGVMFDHRHPKYHLAAAEPFLAARLPLFIDKPFCFDLAKGKDFLARARRKRVPVTSFSTIALSKCFGDFARQVGKAGEICGITSYGPCDLKSKYGGVFFYGIHQVDVLLTLGGPDVEAVCVNRAPGKPDAVATLFWKNGVTGAMYCMTSRSTGFQVSVATSGGNVAAALQSDPSPYLAGAKTFCKMFKTGKQPIDHKVILSRVAVLAAMAKSVKTGKVTKVAAV